MTTETAPTTETTDLIPQKIGGVLVPRNVQALEALLEQTKNRAFPLPFRADVLPPDAQRMLRSMGGLPEYFPANQIELFAGRPYASADGVIDCCIDMGCTLYTEERLHVRACLDPESGCPGELVKKGKNGAKDTVIKAKQGDNSYTAVAHVKKPSGGRYIAYGQCCLHTWQGAAQNRPQMARTRALRTAAKRALGIPSNVTRADDDPEFDFDAEVIEENETSDPVPAPVQASTEGSAAGAAAEAVAEEPPAVSTSDGQAEAPAPVAAGKDKAVYIGKLPVTRASDGPWRADQEGGGRLRTKDQIAKATEILDSFGLLEGALDAVCKARYGVSLAQVSKVAMDELLTWLEAQSEMVKAFGAPDEPSDDEPPF